MSVNTIPSLTEEQRAAALAKAKEARAARADVKKRMRDGEVRVSEAVEMDDPAVARMSVLHLIETQQGYGKARAARLMEELDIAPSKRVGGLGARQRAALVEIFG